MSIVVLWTVAGILYLLLTTVLASLVGKGLKQLRGDWWEV